MVDENEVKQIKMLLQDLFDWIEGEGQGTRALTEMKEKYPELKPLLNGIKPEAKGW